MVFVFKSLFNTLLFVFPILWSIPNCQTHFEDATCLDLKLTSIHTFSKGLSYLHICELRKPKGTRTILIYLKPTTSYVGQFSRLPPCQNTTTSFPNMFLPSIQFMTNWHIEVIKNGQLVNDSQCHFNNFGPTSHILTSYITNTKQYYY